jgi:hypothetical protein
VREIAIAWLTGQPHKGGLLLTPELASELASMHAGQYCEYWEGRNWKRGKNPVVNYVLSIKNWFLKDSRVAKADAWRIDYVKGTLSGPHPEYSWASGKRALENGTMPKLAILNDQHFPSKPFSELPERVKQTIDWVKNILAAAPDEVHRISDGAREVYFRHTGQWPDAFGPKPTPNAS